VDYFFATGVGARESAGEDLTRLPSPNSPLRPWRADPADRPRPKG